VTKKRDRSTVTVMVSADNPVRRVVIDIAVAGPYRSGPSAPVDAVHMKAVPTVVRLCHRWTLTRESTSC